jgi:CubicO group peptidase (beta-lactamase class C family)
MPRSATLRLVSPLLIVLLAACSQGTPPPAEGGDAAVETASRFSAEDEALYLQRFSQLMEAARLGAGLDGYDPLEPVPGAPEAAPLPMAEARRIDAEVLATADEYAEKMNSNALLVWHDGALELERYYGDHDRDALVVSRSLAKPMTAIVVGRALALGYIDTLDQPVADFITEWRDDEMRSKMLIRHLLDMRSGLLPQGLAVEPEHILNRAYLHPRHDEVIIHEYPMVDEPGTRYEYSNATSELVAVVIERATGIRYGEFLSREILQPIGAMGGEIWVNRPGGVAHAGCCLLLPAQTWLRLAKLLLDDGVAEGTRLLPEGYVAEMRTGTSTYPRYGLGVYLPGEYVERRGFANPERQAELRTPGVLHSAPFMADDLFMFDGNANQVVYVVPSQRLIILRTGFNPPRDPEWDNSFLPNLLLEAMATR